MGTEMSEEETHEYHGDVQVSAISLREGPIMLVSFTFELGVELGVWIANRFNGTGSLQHLGQHTL